MSKKKNMLPMLAGAVAISALVITFVNKEKALEEEKLSAKEYYNEFNSIYKENQGQDDFTAQIVPEINKGSSNNEAQGTLNEAGDLVINTGDIGEEATFFQLNVKGVDMAVLAVKAEDGTVRTAFDTCQICNGSPYAYFEQKGDKFQCQNCGNVYSRDMIEKERGGCNPVPIMADEKSETENEIIIPAKVLEDNAGRFKNWKNI